MATFHMLVALAQIAHVEGVVRGMCTHAGGRCRASPAGLQAGRDALP